jgi:hypothetical protein
VSGGGNFGDSESHDFLLPANFNEASDDEPIIGEGEMPLTIVIQLDSYPQEIGWRVDRLGLEVEEIIRVPAGIYTIPQTTVVRTIVLEEGELYYFRIYDVLEDGLDGGYGKSFLVLLFFAVSLLAHRYCLIVLSAIVPGHYRYRGRKPDDL